ncbi:hypothetical protein ATI61_105482 [Archangium gephyra]|uniref:Uncharacterized protein n=1 Tax=Archangium gephyra TaxID=48 RepID=A0AAC8QEZ9_9BACT|nr:hypothetical protein [Archangium gephyra]AKJ06532.1 Hypothetical protein AA314_08158 [Archangium gephyra]REG32154.1 hypothetical protein ATI61_105482 [Archangium gephyra]
MKSRLLSLRRRGQATVEYVVVSAAFLGFTTLGWPFLVQMIDALGKYFQSIYYIIQSPVP